MARIWTIGEETLGYQTSTESSNSDYRYLIAGSQNVLVDYNRKVGVRNGFTRLGAGSEALTPIRNAFTWLTSTGTELPLRFYDDEWEVYLGTVDTTVLDAWYRFKNSMSTTEIPRGAIFFDTAENVDEMILVQGDANLYEWNGAVAVVASSSSGSQTVTKAGTSTFAQNRFYTSANKSFICARTGTEYAYTGGEATTTLTAVTTSGSFDLVAGDVLLQKVVTASNKPASSHTNDTIYSFENQIAVGSFDDNEVWISKNTDYADFSFSSPRVPGEGGLLTLDGPSRGIGAAGKYLLAFAGYDSIFRADYQQITVGSTLTETLRVKRLNVGVNQGSLNPDCIIPVGNALIYLSNEIALRIIENPDNINTTDPKTLSNPIKPDFDAEDWSDAKGIWHKNSLWLSAQANSHVYGLQFVEDADGKVRRFWQPPQVLPADPFFIFGGNLYCGSNSVAETYLLFDPTTFADLVANGTAGNPGDKTPINAIAKFAYQSYGDRARLKTFDEYYVEGEAGPNVTELTLTLGYDFEGSSQTLMRTIDASNEDILEGVVSGNSLAQQSLGVQPIGGLVNPPGDARKFRVIFEIAREDFHELVSQFSTNEADLYWAIIAHGSNAKMSPRRATNSKM